MVMCVQACGFLIFGVCWLDIICVRVGLCVFVCVGVCLCVFVCVCVCARARDTVSAVLCFRDIPYAPILCFFFLMVLLNPKP